MLRIYRPDTNPSEERFLGQFIPLHYHYNMLQDADRVGAFYQAIEQTIKPGMNVVELGGGTGILSSFAARRGARVRCVERNPELVHASKHFIALNQLENQIEVVADDASRFVPPKQIDAVICEMLHVAMLREKQLDVIDSFKKNYLAKHGGPLPRFLPEASVLMVQAVEHEYNFQGYYAPVPLFQAPTQAHPSTCELTLPATYASFCYDEPFPTRLKWSSQIKVEQGGIFNAIRFLTQNLVAILPHLQQSVNWPNQLLVIPVEEPTEVSPGDQIAIAFDYASGDSLEALYHSLDIRVLTKQDSETSGENGPNRLVA